MSQGLYQQPGERGQAQPDAGYCRATGDNLIEESEEGRTPPTPQDKAAANLQTLLEKERDARLDERFLLVTIIVVLANAHFFKAMEIWGAHCYWANQVDSAHRVCSTMRSPRGGPAARPLHGASAFSGSKQATPAGKESLRGMEARPLARTFGFV